MEPYRSRCWYVAREYGQGAVSSGIGMSWQILGMFSKLFHRILFPNLLFLLSFVTLNLSQDCETQPPQCRPATTLTTAANSAVSSAGRPPPLTNTSTACSPRSPMAICPAPTLKTRYTRSGSSWRSAVNRQTWTITTPLSDTKNTPAAHSGRFRSQL